MQKPTARFVVLAFLTCFYFGCGDSATEDPGSSAGGEGASTSLVDPADVLTRELPRPEGAGPRSAEGRGVFQALSSRSIRTVHVLPGTHLAMVESYDDTSSLLDLETGHVRSMRRLAFEGEVEARLTVDETASFAAIAVLPLAETQSGTGPVYLWDIAADTTRVARRAAPPRYAGTSVAIAHGGSEIALFEQRRVYASGSDDQDVGRLVLIDPFTGRERVTDIREASVFDALAYSGPGRRAIVSSHRASWDEGAGWVTRITRDDSGTVEGAVGRAIVRPTGGQMLVRTRERWEMRSPSTGALLAPLDVPADARLAYSSEGECIVAHVDEETFAFFDPHTGGKIAELGAQGVLGLDAIGRCERAVTLGLDRSVVLASLGEDAPTPRRFDAGSFAWGQQTIEPGSVGLASTNDGHFAISWDQTSVVMYDLTRGTSTGLRTFGYSPSVWSVAWSARGDALLAQSRESSFVIDGTDTATTNLECALGYTVQTAANGAFVVEDGRAPICALRANVTPAESQRVIRYNGAGDAVVVLRGQEVELVRSATSKRRVTTLRDLRCTDADSCVIRAVFSRDDRMLALLGRGIVLVVDVAQGRTLARHFITTTPHALAFSRASDEVLAISDGFFERLPVRGTVTVRVELPAPSVMPESSATNAYVDIRGNKLTVISLESPATRAELELEDENWDVITPVSPTEPLLFRAGTIGREFLVDAGGIGTYAIDGTLLGARSISAGVLIARCEENEIKVERLGRDGAVSVGSLGDCTGVRMVAFAPDQTTVAVVRGAEIELRRIDGSTASAFITMLEGEEVGFALANSSGSYHAPVQALPHVRYRAAGDARTAAMTDGTERTGYDAHLLDRFFGRAVAPAAAPATAATP